MSRALAAEGGTELRRRAIVTPEGVALTFTIGRAGDRMAAFLIDAATLALALIALWLALELFSSAGGAWVAAALQLAYFLVRNLYFLWFELRWQGRTPGKRRLGLRVIDADGGTLRAESVVVRNLTREAELFLPIAVLASPEFLVDTGPIWVRSLAASWAALFLLFPLLNRDRRRIGDLLAGTLVVQDARKLLEPELGEEKGGAELALAFTRAQLELYGIYELQVLEELLRDRRDELETLAAVAQRIQRKIGWEPSGAPIAPRDFLAAFYRAQRERLERDLVLGKARERKRAEGPAERGA